MKKGIFFAIFAFLLIGSLAHGTTLQINTIWGEMQGDDFKVSVVEMSDVAGYQFDITYNPAVLQFMEIAYGDFLKHGGVETFKVQPNTETPGEVKAIAEARTGNVAGANRSGELFTAKFERIAEGEGNVKISYSKIVDTQGNKIDAAILESGNPETTGEVPPSISTEMLFFVVIAIVALVWAVFMRKNDK